MIKHQWLPSYEYISGVRDEMVILVFEVAITYCERIHLPREL